jgi:hypothetical protein
LNVSLISLELEGDPLDFLGELLGVQILREVQIVFHLRLMLFVQLLTVFEAVLKCLLHLCPMIIDDCDLSLHGLNLGILDHFKVVAPYLLIDLHDPFLSISDLLNELCFGIPFALKALQEAVFIGFHLRFQVFNILVLTF